MRSLIALAIILSSMAGAIAQDIKIGFVGALSGLSAKSGEAITRGMEVAIDEINAKGGLLGGRKLVLVKRDDESNPAKGQIAARELIQNEKVAAIFGGIDTPVAMAIVPIANKEKTPYVGTWAAGTLITRNGAAPNYVFRVSAVDVLVDKALVNYASKAYSAKKPGMMLINNPWGESNEKGLIAALGDTNIASAGVEKFEEKDIDMTPQLARLKANGADAIFLGIECRPRGASHQVDGTDELECACHLALGHIRGPFSRAGGRLVAESGVHPDLQFLWPAERRRQAESGRAHEKVFRHKVRCGYHAAGRLRECVRRHAVDGDGDRCGRRHRRRQDSRRLLQGRRIQGSHQDV